MVCMTHRWREADSKSQFRERVTAPNIALMMQIRRRAVLVGTSAIASAGSLPAPAIAQGIRELKLVTDWGSLKETPGQSGSADRLARTITAMSDGRLNVTVYPAGSLVRAFETFDAVSAGVADMYHTDEIYFQDRAPALISLRRPPMV